MARREWTDKDKALALTAVEANAGNVKQTSRMTGIPEATLRGWVKGKYTNADVAEIHAEKKGELADELERIAWVLAGAIEGKIQAAALSAVATSLGITVDKMQILRGKPSEIVDDASLTDGERAERITRLLDKARERRAGQAALDDGDTLA